MDAIPGLGAAPAHAGSDQAARLLEVDLLGAAELGDRLVEIVRSPGFVPVALVIAFVAGAAHGLAPGHGKSLAAAYLIGSRGRVRDAAWLGFSVAAMHTVSVLTIAVAWTFFALSGLVSLERLTTGLQLVAGLTVVAVGLWLLRRHLRRPGGGAASADGVTAPPAKEATSRRVTGHAHGHAHSHSHASASRPGLLLLGMSGGLTPSPAAFLVLVTGIFAGRAGFALVLVVCFGLGLAAVLFTVGLMALTGRALVARAAESRVLLRLAARIAPVLAACGITLIGVGISAAAVTGLPGT
jgi:ABC-type nickel/cobalt efflux system permease component RcnA